MQSRFPPPCMKSISYIISAMRCKSDSIYHTNHLFLSHSFSICCSHPYCSPCRKHLDPCFVAVPPSLLHHFAWIPPKILWIRPQSLIPMKRTSLIESGTLSAVGVAEVVRTFSPRPLDPVVPHLNLRRALLSSRLLVPRAIKRNSRMGLVPVACLHSPTLFAAAAWR